MSHEYSNPLDNNPIVPKPSSTGYCALGRDCTCVTPNPSSCHNWVTPRMEIDSSKRKEVPIASGCLDYFPDALAAVAELSWHGNNKHNPGQPLHWARGKSNDHADCIMRHFIERGTVDVDGIRHSVKVAWRALALLQEEIEAANGLPPSRGSKV